jgi:hypothetical protein
MFQPSVPQPCFQQWEAMQPQTGGAFCQSCAKTVIDFSQMSDAELHQYLLQHRHQKICGRFRQTQLTRIKIEIPGTVFTQRIPYWKKFLAACLLCFALFMSGCSSHGTKASLEVSKKDTIVKKEWSNTTGGMLTVIKEIPALLLPPPLTGTSIGVIDETCIVGAIAPPIVPDPMPQEYLVGKIAPMGSVVVVKDSLVKKATDSIAIQPGKDSCTTKGEIWY